MIRFRLPGAGKQVVRTDGMKLVFDDGSWVCDRLWGTEPVVRVYSEGRSPEALKTFCLAS